MGSGDAGVLATGLDRGRPVLEGVRYREGVEVRRARIYLDVPGAEGTGKLAQFLDDGAPGDGIEVLKTDATLLPREPGRRRPRGALAVLGVGALALAGSSAWYLASPDDDHAGPDYDDWKSPAVVAFVGGSIAVGAGVYLHLRRSSSTGAITAAMLGAGTALLLSGAMLYATDEDLYLGTGWQRPYYRDTAALGLIAGGAGFALTVAGLWSLRRARRDTPMPVVFVERDRGFIGWTGRL
jgi:hypothetical protein